MSEAEINLEVGEESTPQVSEAVQRALNDGWVPLEQWEGDPDDWVDHKQFNIKGELMKRIKSQSKELSEFKKTAQQFAEHYSKVKEQAYKEALADLKQAKKVALEEQDYDQIVELDEQISDLKAQQAQEVEVTNTPPPFVQYWLEENPWYDTDNVMRAASEAIATRLVQEQPHLAQDQAQLLDKVAIEVRKEFPHKFQKVANTPSKTAAPTNTADNKTKTTKTVALTREEQEVAERFVKLGFVKSVEEYAQSLRSL